MKSEDWLFSMKGISVKVEDELVDLLDHLAQLEYKKRSEVIREAMVQYLERKLGEEEYLDFVTGLRAMEESVEVGVEKGRSGH